MPPFQPIRFGKYLLLEKLATGGMAQLYRATIVGVQGFEKFVALKQVLPHLAEEKEFLGSFIDEAKLAALLQHQNIVQIYDTSLGKKMDEYYKVTYQLTMHFGETVSRLNKNMVFIYVSGAGTDGTEKDRIEWARIKGKTENDLMKLPFRRAYGYRPRFIKPYQGQTRAHSFYRSINWFLPIGKKLFPKGFNTMEELALSIISLVKEDHPQNIIAEGR